MLHPTIEELTQGKYNRYELALATAKCARLITDEYIRQHDAAERSQTGNKETDRPINTMIDKELRDEKAVKVAISRLYSGAYRIDLNADGEEESADDAEAPTEVADPSGVEESAPENADDEAGSDGY